MPTVERTGLVTLVETDLHAESSQFDPHVDTLSSAGLPQDAQLKQISIQRWVVLYPCELQLFSHFFNLQSLSLSQ